MKRAIVTGASSGLGKLIKEQLVKNDYDVTNWSLDKGVNVASFDSVQRAAAKFIDDMELPERQSAAGTLEVLVNCAGINGGDWLPELEEADWDYIMSTNAKGIFLTSQALSTCLKGGTILNIVSNAAHIPMTTSLAYNMSKAAALMATKQLARELIKTHGITVFSVSPNKLKGTNMSQQIEKRVCELRGWTPEEAEKYQLAALPAGAETPPEVLAEFIGFLLSSKERHRYLAGCDITYGGPTI